MSHDVRVYRLGRIALAVCLGMLSVALVAMSAAASARRVPAEQARDVAAGERHIVVSDGTDLYVKIAGHGPICMLVHGGPGQGSLSTEKMGVDKLESFLTMIYLDQRGSGRSRDASNYHIGRVVRDFEEVRRKLGVDRLCLIAHSFGGLLAVEYARRYPSHVSAIILANASLQFLGPYNSRMKIELVNRLLGREVVKVPTDTSALADAREQARAALMKSGMGYRFLTNDIQGIKRMGEIDSGYERSHGFGRSVFDQSGSYPEYYTDYAPASAAIRQPVLVISSREDYAVGPEEYRRFRFPRQTTTLLDGGHMSYYEQNAGFVAAIRDFLHGDVMPD